jgi:hypothetical protein
MHQVYGDVVKKRSLVAAAAVCAVAMGGAGAGAAFGGEVKGPPGKPGFIGSGSEADTGAPAHANSICAYSGLNDFRAENGQIIFHVQSPGQEHRLGFTPPGIPGEACGPGTNPERVK